MVGRVGVEPTTSRLSGVRSDHLSYRPAPALRRQSRQSRALWRAVPRWPCSSTCKIADAISSRGLPRMKAHEDGGLMFFGMQEALPRAEALGAFRRYP